MEVGNTTMLRNLAMLTLCQVTITRIRLVSGKKRTVF